METQKEEWLILKDSIDQEYKCLFIDGRICEIYPFEGQEIHYAIPLITIFDCEIINILITAFDQGQREIDLANVII